MIGKVLRDETDATHRLSRAAARTLQEKVFGSQPQLLGLRRRKVARSNVPKIDRAMIGEVGTAQHAYSELAGVVPPVAGFVFGEKFREKISPPVFRDLTKDGRPVMGQHPLLVPRAVRPE